MNILTLLPFIVLIGAMFLMTRSAKRKQQQAAQMRDQMQPGTGVRTIGGLYATVKEVNHDTVLLEAAPGVHLVFAKNSIGAVLDDEEYNRIVHGDGDLKSDGPVVPDDASSLTEATDSDSSDDAKIDLGKKPEAADAEADDTEVADAKPEDAESKNGKADGETDAK
ncbi:preprotein translocase subunit YajC [Streptomyces sp. NBC_00191]|uniref:preprotein translocase subunit YajC n=1 Tax=Streptomyces sp. NBC_00191 TaxID=2975674 RepID=UPI00324C0B68